MTQLVPRGWYAAHIHYDTPACLEDLRGPRGGKISVGPHINTAADPTYDLDEFPGDRWQAYRAIIRDGYADDHVRFLNKEWLIHLWPDLILPRRCRQEWERKFPELAALPTRALILG